jgi:hypothetical protein
MVRNEDAPEILKGPTRPRSGSASGEKTLTSWVYWDPLVKRGSALVWWQKPRGWDPTMKTMFLLLVALVLSAQGIDETIHRAPFAKPYMPDEYFTMHRLSGHWWANATPVERKIYSLA